MNWNAVTLRERENLSIEAFVEMHADKLSGRVLDYGCGRQPFRRIVQRAGGDYVPYDRVGFAASVAHTSVGPDKPLAHPSAYDTILCTQVLQYVHGPLQLLTDFCIAIKPGGWLVLTGPTNWPEVEPEDLWRFTSAGVRHLLVGAGFQNVETMVRETLVVNDLRLALGYGAVSQA